MTTTTAFQPETGMLTEEGYRDRLKALGGTQWKIADYIEEWPHELCILDDGEQKMADLTMKLLEAAQRITQDAEDELQSYVQQRADSNFGIPHGVAAFRYASVADKVAQLLIEQAELNQERLRR